MAKKNDYLSYLSHRDNQRKYFVVFLAMTISFVAIAILLWGVTYISSDAGYWKVRRVKLSVVRSGLFMIWERSRYTSGSSAGYDELAAEIEANAVGTLIARPGVCSTKSVSLGVAVIETTSNGAAYGSTGPGWAFDGGTVIAVQIPLSVLFGAGVLTVVSVLVYCKRRSA